MNGLEGAVRLSDIAKRMMAVMGVMLLLLVAGSAVYYRSLDFLPFALGALLGGGLYFAGTAVEKMVKTNKQSEQELSQADIVHDFALDQIESVEEGMRGVIKMAAVKTKSGEVCKIGTAKSKDEWRAVISSNISSQA